MSAFEFKKNDKMNNKQKPKHNNTRSPHSLIKLQWLKEELTM